MKAIQKLVGNYRTEIKGIAILWVAFFHAQLGLDGFLYDVQKIGYGGVDMFFFLSGFGLWHSLSRGTKGYFRRRAERILPAYLPFCIVWLAVMIPLSNMGMGKALHTIAGNVLMVGYFLDTPLMINWYVSALTVSLIIAPVLYWSLQGERGSLIRAGALLAGAAALGLLFVGDVKYMAVSRLPVFILGMLFARPVKKDGKAVLILLAVGAVCALAALLLCFEKRPDALLRYAMYWHPFVLIAPALCCGLGWIFARCPAGMLKPLRFIGEASFEIFLFNVWAELLGKRYGLGGSAAAWVALTVGSILLGLVYHRIVQDKKFCAFLKKRA